MKTKLFILCCASVLLKFNMKAQEVIATSGNYHENSSGSISWTIGELVSEAFENSENILTQGFHQTMLTVTLIKEFKETDIQITVYPNPVKEKLIIDVKEAKFNSLQMTMIDINGRIELTKNIVSDKEIIDMQGFPEAIYILRIIAPNEKILKSYKIVKQ